MKPRTKKLLFIACALAVVASVLWFAPGPITGAYRPGSQSADGPDYFVYLSEGRARIYTPDDPPPLDAGAYARTSRGWEWTSEPAKVITVVEPHLLYMRCKQDNGYPPTISFREFRFWKVRPVLADPKQQKMRQRGRANPVGAGNGGIASPWHSWLGTAAVPDQHRSAD